MWWPKHCKLRMGLCLRVSPCKMPIQSWEQVARMLLWWWGTVQPTPKLSRRKLWWPQWSPKVTYILVFQDHLTKHVLAYMTPNQTAKTITKFLYQGYILIFGAPARLLSDQGANFMSSVINEMCKILSVKKLQTMPYHPQTNGLVERLHQTIMRMIGKLGEDKKANWPGHLAEIGHTYNANCSAMTGYRPHYLKFEGLGSQSTFTSPL